MSSNESDEVNPMSDQVRNSVPLHDESVASANASGGSKTDDPARTTDAGTARETSGGPNQSAKNLDCIHCIAGALGRSEGSVDRLLQDIVELMPDALRHAEIACARITCDGRDHRTANFEPSRWKLAADIFIVGRKAGCVEVHYIEPTSVGDEDPFLAEERSLIRAVARCTGRTVDRIQTEHKLQERIKELNCLFGISRLVEQCEGSLDDLLQGIVDLLSGSWQYPDSSCARIVLEGREYRTACFRPSQWRQAADIHLSGKKVGDVEVYYSKKMPILDEGPFLKEKRLLIDAVGERVGTAVDGIRAKQRLEVEREALQNMNIALREVLARAREEKADLAGEIQANIDKVVVPLLDSLEAEVRSDQRDHVRLLRRNLEEITSPFADKLSKAFMSLTPAEIQVCDMIRRGLATKEIARLRKISQATVSRHREHIRSKLGLTNKTVNLATYLHTFMSQSASEDHLPEHLEISPSPGPAPSAEGGWSAATYDTARELV